MDDSRGRRFPRLRVPLFLRPDHPKSWHGLTRYNCGETQWHRFGALRQSIATGQSVDLQVFGVRMRTYWADHPEARALFDVAMRSTAIQVRDAVVRAYDPVLDEEIVEERVAARQARAHIFKNPGKPRYWAVLDEMVVRRPVGGPAVMAAQLRHIAAMVRRQSSAPAGAGSASVSKRPTGRPSSSPTTVS